MPALLLDLSGTGAARALALRRDRLVLEAADAVELGLVEPVEQQLEVLLGLAGEADDEGGADREAGQTVAPAPDALERVLCGAGRFMSLSTAGCACWNGMSR